MARPPVRSGVAPLAKVLRAPKQGKLTVGILSPRLLRLAVHWDQEGRREQLCWRALNQDCPFCVPANSHREGYYAIATTGASDPPCVLHLTTGAVDYCPELLARVDDCRGLALILERIGRGGAVRVTVRPEPMKPEALTDPGDWLWPFLHRLFRVPTHLREANPDPAPVEMDVAAAVKGRAGFFYFKRHGGNPASDPGRN